MVYKDFVAEAAQKIMASVVSEMSVNKQEIKKYARGCVVAAKALADALEEDWQNTPVDSIHRFSEKEEYFDNYVNWTQNR